MLSGIDRFTIALVLCLSVVVSSPLIVSPANAATWVPIKTKGLTVFIPQAKLDSVQADTFQYGHEAVLKLNGFGVTSAIYYQTQSWLNGSYGPATAWACHDKATLTANNNNLKLPLVSGRYQANVVAMMRNESCDLSTFEADSTFKSEVYTSNEFMVINHQALSSTDSSLAQDTRTVPLGPGNTPVLASYDLKMHWPAVEGADAYQLTVLKDNVPYTAFNNVTNPIPLAELTGTQFTVKDLFFPGDTIDTGTFTAYTGPGQYHFSINYCFSHQCSNPISYDQTITVAPLMPTYYTADNRAEIYRLNGNEVQFWWKADKRTSHFAITEQRVSNTAEGNEYTQLAEMLPNHNSRGAGYIGTPNYLDNGRTIEYTHVTSRPFSGSFRYFITGCGSHCQINGQVPSQSITLFSDSTIPYGQLDAYALGKPGNAHITGWAFDDNIPDGSSQKTDVRLKINGYGTNGDQQSAGLFSTAAGDYHGFDFDLDAMINSHPSLNSSDVLQLELWAYDHGGSAANGGYVLIDTLTINKLLKDKPIVVDDRITLEKGQSHEINVTFNDVDWDEDTVLLTPTIVAAPTHGTVEVLDNGRMAYHSIGLADEILSDSFSYRVTDRLSQLSDNTATVTIDFADFVAYDDVSFVDWTAQTGQVAAARQSTTTTKSLISSAGNGSIILDVRSNDYNAGLAQVVVDTQGSSGSVVADSEGRLVYTLNGDAPLSDSFSYHLLVGGQKTSNSANVYLNTSPTPVADHLPVQTNTTTQLDVTANDHRGVLTDSHQLIPVIKASPSHGTIRVLNGGGSEASIVSALPSSNPVVEYTPHQGFTGTDSFSYSLQVAYDGLIKFSRTATVTIEVGEIPTAVRNLQLTAGANKASFGVQWDSNNSQYYELQMVGTSAPITAEQIGDSAWQPVTTTTATFYAANHLFPEYYHFRVRGCHNNSIMCGDWRVSSQVRAISNVITGLAVNKGSDGISLNLRWDNNGSDTFSVQQVVNATSTPLTSIAEDAWQDVTKAVSATTLDLDDLMSGYYYFRVNACNDIAVCGEWVTTAQYSIINDPKPYEATGGTVPDDDLPTGSTSDGLFVGAMPGSASVSGGAASYHIPIAVPPGRNGVQPNIALNYSSRSGNGIAGVGWGLSAGGAISRCAPTRAQDGFSTGIAYDISTDKLCLNGQRLMLKTEQYGHINSTYATEMDSFVTVTLRGGDINSDNSYFEVTRPNGSKHTYGQGITNQVQATDALASTATLAPMSWLLNQEADVSGNNTLTYVYHDYGDGEMLLSEINYTNDTGRKVAFAYEDKAQFSTRYLAGGKTRQTKRLTNISTFINSTTAVRDYTLAYHTSGSSGRTLLSSITACAHQGGTLCHQPTTFDWSDEAISFKTEMLTDSAGTELFPARDVEDLNGNISKAAENLFNVIPRGDSNGDGVRDMQGYYLNAEGDSSPNPLGVSNCLSNSWLGGYQCMTADFDLDGKTDQWLVGPGGDNLTILYSNDAAVPLATTIALGPDDVQGTMFSIADFNGDGWPDIFYNHKMLTGERFVLYLHSGDKTDPYNTPGVEKFAGAYLTNKGSTLAKTIAVMGDMNGDGLPDLVTSFNTDKRITPQLTTLRLTRLIDGVVDFEDAYGINFVPGNNLAEYSKFIDVNGDGLLDWVGLMADDTTERSQASSLYLKLNQGNGTFATAVNLGVTLAMKDVIRAENFNEPKAAEEHQVAKYGGAYKTMDVDGDGQIELIMPGTRIVEGCHTVEGDIIGDNTRCGDDLYVQYSDGDQLYEIPASADFSIYQYDALHFIEAANGDYSAEIRPTDLVGAANHSVVVDSLGKGLADLLFVYGCYNAHSGCSIKTPDSGSPMADRARNTIYTNRNYGATAVAEPTKHDYQPNDMLQSVTNGVGIVSQWDYRPLSSDKYADFYSVDFTDVVDDEHFHFASSMYAVAKFEQSNGIGGLNATKYQYRGAMYNTQGRGFRGFSTIIEIDEANADMVTSTDFLQKFPFSSQIDTQTVTPAGKIVPLSLRTNDWQRNPTHQAAASNSNIYHLYNSQTRSIRCDLQATSCGWGTNLSQTQTVIDTDDIDQYGNVSRRVSTVEDQYSTQTTTVTAAFDSSATWPNKVDWQTVKQTVLNSDGQPSTVSASGIETNTAKTVTTHYVEYDTVQRKPSTVVVAAGSTALDTTACATQSDCISTSSVYNTYGLPTTVTVTGNTLTGTDDTNSTQTRTTTFSYTSDHYFPKTVTQQLNSGNHITTVVTDPATGANTRTTDINGLMTDTAYDAFGRPLQVSKAGYPNQYMRYRQSDDNAPTAAIMMVEVTQAGTPASARYVDKLGRTLRTRTEGFAGELIYQDVSYNARGQTLSESVPYAAGDTSYHTTYSDYDVLGRAGQKISPQTNGTLTAKYTYAGLTTQIDTTVTSGSALSMSRTFNSRQQLVQTVDAIGGKTQYVYNGGGSPVVIQDVSGNAIFAKYDALGRKTWVDDPNQGKTVFSYNAFGELEKETDANNAIIRYDMDALGRVTQRNAAGSIAHFTWDTLKKGLPTSHSENGISKRFSYDSLARPVSTTINIDGNSYTTTQAYDANYGRLKSLAYPNELTVGLHYNERGYLHQETNANSGYIYREITAQDALGNMTHACLAGSSTATCGSGSSGFNLTADTLYSLKSGQMLSTQATGMRNAATAIVHHMTYDDYDSYGNLRRQDNLVEGIMANDQFSYDKLHRLTQSRISATNFSTSIDYAYDAVGNLLKKTDYSADSNSAYRYTAGTNQLSQVDLKAGGNTSFTYDNKGNLTHRNNSLETTYNVFNKPLNINRLTADLNFTYGADLARYKQVRVVNGETITTHYIDKLYEVEIQGQHITTKAYISDVAIVSDGNQAGDKNIRFTLRDRLGSTTTFTDENGEVTAYRHFDPFGKPMNGDWALLDPARLTNNLLDMEMPTRRGFTDHEHLDEVELIHMNGRVYDYNVGRFMSVDPLIQGDGNSQGINPYSYIMNNPMAGTDPTGYKIEEETKVLKAATTGSRIKKKVGTQTTTTVTNDKTGEVTSVTSATVLNNGKFAGASTSYSNGKATSSTTFHGDAKGGSSGSTTMDIGSTQETAKTSTAPGRANAASDSDGNTYSFRTNYVSGATATSAHGLIHGVQNQGQGYREWIKAGGDKSAWDHPLVQMGLFFGGDALATQIASRLFGAGIVANASANTVRASSGKVFWSGPGAQKAAATFAKATGAVTLEMTLKGKSLSFIGKFVSQEIMAPLWSKASISFAKGAQGAVDVFHSSRGIKVRGDWRKEYGVLKEQGNGINYHLVE